MLIPNDFVLIVWNSGHLICSHLSNLRRHPHSHLRVILLIFCPYHFNDAVVYLWKIKSLDSVFNQVHSQRNMAWPESKLLMWIGFNQYNSHTFNCTKNTDKLIIGEKLYKQGAGVSLLKVELYGSSPHFAAFHSNPFLPE